MFYSFDHIFYLQKDENKISLLLQRAQIKQSRQPQNKTQLPPPPATAPLKSQKVRCSHRTQFRSNQKDIPRKNLSCLTNSQR